MAILSCFEANMGKLYLLSFESITMFSWVLKYVELCI